ncbi:NAD(P)H-hydrate dehydratase [Fusobacterium sp. PH5-44]|uniref:NAD(P)H-hydrate dehydratase n=1 Tax=unclassified Fusobacterium TaxID=2648384 RepID=UPI003D2382DC
MKILTSKEVYKSQKEAIENFGIPSLTLLGSAALAATDIIISRIKDYNRRNILIFAGKGDNGGNGFAIGRMLYSKGYNVIVIFLEEKSKISNDALINMKRANNLDIVESPSLVKIKKYVMDSDIVVDALFDYECSEKIEKPYDTIIEYINNFSKHTISIEIPSGLNKDTGAIANIAVKADETIVFECPKLGLLIRKGPEYAGHMTVTDINFPKEIVNNLKTKYYYINKKEAYEMLPKQNIRSTKDNFEYLAVIGGQSSMVGALYLTSKSAYRVGAGVVSSYLASSEISTLQTLIPEAIIQSYNQENLSTIIENVTQYNGIVIGPGMGISEINKFFLKEILLKANNNIVIDADGISNLIEIKEFLHSAQKIPVITPHLGEMSRLTGVSIKKILEQPLETASSFAREHNTIVLLKDSRTIIAHPNGQIYINTTGSLSLAKGGSGDVLSGIIGGLIAQGLDSFQSCILGAYIHGLAEELAAKELTNYSLLASDIVNNIPKAIKDILKLQKYSFLSNI